MNDTSQAYMLKEAAVQGVSTVKVWDCTSACYSKRFLETAGAKAEGEYVDMPFVPVEEAKYNPAVKAYVKSVGSGVVDGNGEAGVGRRTVLPRRGEQGREAGWCQRAHPSQLPDRRQDAPLVQRRRHDRHERHPGQEGDALLTPSSR